MLLNHYLLFLLLCLISNVGICSGIKLSTFQTNIDSTLVVNEVQIESGENKMIAKVSDSLYMHWKVSGSKFDGTIDLFVSQKRGVGWQFVFGQDSLRAIIAADYRNSGDPHLVSITTNFIAGIAMLENIEPECQSSFRTYTIKNSWDADVEYNGNYAFELQNNKPCSEGKWKVKLGKLKMNEKIKFAALFTAVTLPNLRYLLKSGVLEKQTVSP